MHAFVLSSPGAWDRSTVAQAALDALRSGGMEVEVCRDKLSDEDLRKAVADADLAVAMGGDGTARLLTRAAHGLDKPIGLIPMGTANDLARTLRLDGDPVAAAEVIVAGRRVPIDVSRINGEIFLNVASFGISAETSRLLNTERKRIWGSWSYARACFEALAKRRAFAVTVTVDGKRETLRAIQVGIANGRFQGGGAEVHPDARIDDGRLWIYVVEPQTLGRLVLLAITTKTGGQRLWDGDGLRFFTGREVEVDTKRPRTVSVDGDLVARTPATLTIEPRAQSFFVPEEFEPTHEPPVHDATAAEAPRSPTKEPEDGR